MTDNALTADDLSEFRSTFFEECGDMLSSIDVHLGGADRGPPDAAALKHIFRAVHSIKGSAGFFNLDAIVDFAHAFETLLGAAREDKISCSETLGRLLVEGADVLASIIDKSRDGKVPPPDLGKDVIERIEALLRTSESTGTPRAADHGAHDETASEGEPRRVEIRFILRGTSTDGTDPHASLLAELGRLGEVIVLQEPQSLPKDPGGSPHYSWIAELVTHHSDEDIRKTFDFVDHELEIRASTPAPRASAVISTDDVPRLERETPEAEAPLQAEARNAKGRASVSTIRVDLARVDRLVNMVGELVITQAMLTQQLADQQGGNRQQLRQGHEDLANYTRELQECVMAIRMQPVRSVFSRIPRLVREIAGKLGKKVRLVMSGEQTEIDKTVVEELADPLLHMIRNAIDHGIESAEKRSAAGKSEVGLIELSAMQRGGNILITLSDDGAGIDRQRVRSKAVERGIIPPDAVLSGEDIDHLIFAPGFSTAEAVTDVSGRGVGMDVVLSNITNLGGRIQIQSTLGRGTKFTLVLPLTLAVLDGMMVSIARETYILPLTNIVETIRPDRRVVRQLANGTAVVAIRGEFIRLVNMGELFGLEGAIREPWKALVVVVELDNGSKLGIVVDELIGQRQVVVKSLQENFDPVPGISGATILGTGRVALILDIEQLSRIGGRHMHSASMESFDASSLSADAPTGPTLVSDTQQQSKGIAA